MLRATLWGFGAVVFVALVWRLSQAKPAVAIVTPPVVSAAPAPPEPVVAVGEVKRLTALEQYAVDAVVGLMPAYAERNIETKESRIARWTSFAIEIADAVEASGVKEKAEYVISLLFIAHRETVLAKNPFNVGNCDEGTSLGPWSMKEWRGVDRFHAAGALKLLTTAPGAWSLPSKPWLGLVIDKRLNRPSAASYLARHPYAADDGSSSAN